MKFNAIAKFVKTSPTKLRPMADEIRGKSVKYALGWLAAYGATKTVPIKKIIESAAANAKHLHDIEKNDLYVCEIKVDQGPTFKYHKPGAMGRSNVYRKRLSHISVILKNKDTN
jgi:large subunit ribosomal protein L22